MDLESKLEFLINYWYKARGSYADHQKWKRINEHKALNNYNYYRKLLEWIRDGNYLRKSTIERIDKAYRRYS